MKSFVMRNDEEELADNLQFIFMQLPLLAVDEDEAENLPVVMIVEITGLTPWQVKTSSLPGVLWSIFFLFL